MRPSDWDRTPSAYFPAELGVVEVQPIWPGWSVDGQASAGPPDGGGPDSVALLAAAARFARGVDASEEGWTVGQLVGQPTCLGPVPLLAMSSGGVPAAGALEAPELAEGLLGAVFFEAPPLPELLTLEPGAIWMDPDPDIDADGNGVPWDDGRNHAFDEAACLNEATCSVNPGALAWTDDVSLSDVWVGQAGAALAPGLLFLDVDADGVLDLNAAGSTDVNEDGRIGPGEDAIFKPFVPVDDADPHIYSPRLTAAAAALFGESFPARMASPAHADAFWATRTPLPRLAPALVAASSPPVRVTYTEEPHGVSASGRVDTRLLFDTLLGAGVDVSYNVRADVADCYFGAHAASYEAAPAGSLSGAEMARYAIPERVTNALAQSSGVVDIWWSTVGPPRACVP